MDLRYHLIAFLVSFAGVFLKGFQLKNVQHNNLKSIFGTSYLIAAFEITSVLLMVKMQWIAAIPIGTGGGLGMLASIYAHKKLFKTKD